MWPIWRCGTQLLKICMSNCDSRTLGTFWRDLGPHRSSEKTVQIDKHLRTLWVYHKTDKRKKSQSLFWECKWPLISKKKTWVPITQWSVVPSLVKIDMVILEKIYKLPQRIFAISLLSALEKGHNSLFEQTWISFTQKVFVTSLLEIDPGVLEKIFEFRKYISCFLIISNCKVKTTLKEILMQVII